MTKTEFKKQAKLFIQQNSKLSYVRLAMENRVPHVSDHKRRNFVENRGLKEVKDFVDNNYNVSGIDEVWSYIRAIPPYNVPLNEK